MNALLPFKGLGQAKTRWPTELGDRKSTVLLELLQHNLQVVASVLGAEATHLVSPPWEGREALTGCRHLEVNGTGLNQDLEQARRLLQGAGSSLLVLLPDLPLLKAEEVEALLEASRHQQVTVCPDRDGVGTNALVLRPSDCLEFAFEGASARRHRESAEANGLSVSEFLRPGLAQDCDEPVDLERFSLL